MIKGYAEDSNLTIINTMYHFPKKQNDTGKWTDGSITIVAKDNDRNIKIVEEINDPTYQYYIKKEEFQQDYNEFFTTFDKVDMVEVPYRELEKDIATRTNNLDFYYDNIRNGNKYANKKLHTHTRIFNSDLHIEDHYRFRFNKLYKNNPIEVSKSYLDIEADTINMKGDFPELGECPINAITLINDNSHEVFTLLLRNKNNPLIEEFEKNLDKSFFVELNNLIKQTVGGYKQARRLDVDNYKFKLFFYNEDEEIKLIQDVFIIINTLQPDFVLAWNMAFDIPYIIHRIKNLGYNPEDIICHPDFKTKVCEYFIDEQHKNEYAERGDYAKISSYSVYLDQMIQFASRRKGQSAFTSFKLDYIGNVVAGARKLDYSHITLEIAKLPYLDYKTFVMYNIVDTIVQKCIEIKVGDIDYVFNKCLVNSTRYSKCHRQSVYLANKGVIEFDNLGYVIGNNTNKFNEKPKTKFPGAFVADPKNISDYSKIKIADTPVMIFDNLDDFDYARLYPSILQEFNIAPNTQIGKLTILEKVFNKENKRNDEKYSRSGQFMEDLQSHIFLEFGSRWLHLGTYEDLYDDIIEYFSNKANSCRSLNIFTDIGNIKPIHIIKQDLSSMKPISEEKNIIKPINQFKSPEIKAVLNKFNNEVI